uniref:Retrotransposon protein, putative, unclassified n=1 Tax=Tanacetum cinerariifolium TaxID=118510 RepID=A0A6L2K3S5_TANCI|nr:retrotransposon protein, putative, unclassified [Tanacetum cinerariifolium]
MMSKGNNVIHHQEGCDFDIRTMDTIIEQQVAMDEALVPHAQRVPGQSFDEPPFEEEILAFIRFFRHSAAIRTLTNVNINKLYQPWRSFAAIINKCLTEKSSGYDSLRISQAQILWGLYHKRNIDYAYLLWEDLVYQALYWLKQAPHARYDMLSSFLISQDFSKGSVDPTLFIRRNDNDLLLVQIYVDDIIFATSTHALCDLFANLMCSEFKMSMMGKISFFLGLQISQSPRGIFINQSKYGLESLKKYGFESCDPVDTPMVEKSKLDEDKEGKAVDLSYYHVKRIFRYLRGTVNRGLWYPKDSSVALTTFADVDHAGCQDTRRSTSGSLQFLGERLISWSSKRQKTTAISSTEAKYIALSGCCAQILWMQSQLTDYGLGFNKIPMYCDNKSVTALCCNNVQHSRSKHINIRYHFIKEQVENRVIELYFVNTEYQLADLLTKALGRDRIEFFINKLGMRSFTPETLKQLMDEVDE